MNSRRHFILQTIALLPTVQLFAWSRDKRNNTQLDELKRIEQLLAGKEPVKWVFLGDSITQGAKHTSGWRSYTEIFAERIRWELKRVRDIVINSGISGNTTVDLLNEFNWRVKQFSPSVVILMIGTNDASQKKNISPTMFYQNLVRLIDEIREMNAVPVLQTPNPILIDKAPERSDFKNYVSKLLDIAKNKHVVLIDHFSIWQKQASSNPIRYYSWFNDELHPNAKGHSVIAKEIFRALNIYDENAFTCSD